jgi:hypothetical protein
MVKIMARRGRERLGVVWPSGELAPRWFACGEPNPAGQTPRMASGQGEDELLAWLHAQSTRQVDVMLSAQHRVESLPSWHTDLQAHAALLERLQEQIGQEVALDFCAHQPVVDSPDIRALGVWWVTSSQVQQVEQALQHVGARCRSVQVAEFALARGLVQCAELGTCVQPVRWSRQAHTQWLWLTRDGLMMARRDALPSQGMATPGQAPSPALASDETTVVWVLGEGGLPSEASDEPQDGQAWFYQQVTEVCRGVADPPWRQDGEVAGWLQAMGAAVAEVPA